MNQISHNRTPTSTKQKPTLVSLLMIALLISAARGLSKAPPCKSLECRFSSYLEAHEIKLASPMERAYRFKIFKRNLKEVETFNLSHPEIKLDLNDFGILTRKEFKKTMTNPDFLFLDEQGRKHHVNENDPRNKEVAGEQVVDSNLETLKAIRRQVQRDGGSNALFALEWDLEGANDQVESELDHIHDFLRTHHVRGEGEILDADGGRFAVVGVRFNFGNYKKFWE